MTFTIEQLEGGYLLTAAFFGVGAALTSQQRYVFKDKDTLLNFIREKLT